MKSKNPADSLDAFRLVELDEGVVRGTPNRRRLVCNIDGGGKLVIWGREGSNDATVDASLFVEVAEERPAKRVVELTPQVWKTLFSDRLLRSDLDRIWDPPPPTSNGNP